MFSPAKAITAGALAIAIGGVFLVAQPKGQDGSALPGVTTSGVGDPCTTAIVPVIGDLIWGNVRQGDQSLQADNGVHVRDWIASARMDVDDDRLDGATTGAIDWDISYNGQGFDTAGVNRGTFRIENDRGAWEGPWSGVGAGPHSSWQALISLTGSGGYEGLSAILFAVPYTGSDSVDGSIYPTDIATCDFG